MQGGGHTSERVTISVSSVTYAMKGAELLARNGIKRRIIKVKNSKNGCQYGISVDKPNADRAQLLLLQSGIPNGGIVKE